METSSRLTKLAEALAKAQGEIEAAKKDSTNPHFKSKYADLASVWAAIREPLSKHGLSVVQPVTSSERSVTVATIIMHSSGEQIAAGILTVPVTAPTPQAFGSAITYARRYALMSAVGVAPDDDDGNAASGNHTPPPSNGNASRTEQVKAALASKTGWQPSEPPPPTDEEMQQLQMGPPGPDFEPSGPTAYDMALAQSDEPTLSFGKSKGKKPSEIGDSDLTWYGKVVAESVEDPSKAKFRPKNQALLTALRAEQARRRQ